MEAIRKSLESSTTVPGIDKALPQEQCNELADVAGWQHLVRDETCQERAPAVSLKPNSPRWRPEVWPHGNERFAQAERDRNTRYTYLLRFAPGIRYQRGSSEPWLWLLNVSPTAHKESRATPRAGSCKANLQTLNLRAPSKHGAVHAACFWPGCYFSPIHACQSLRSTHAALGAYVVDSGPEFCRNCVVTMAAKRQSFLMPSPGRVLRQSNRHTHPSVGTLLDTLQVVAEPVWAACFQAMPRNQRKTHTHTHTHAVMHFGSTCEARAGFARLMHNPQGEVGPVAGCGPSHILSREHHRPTSWHS